MKKRIVPLLLIALGASILFRLPMGMMIKYIISLYLIYIGVKMVKDYYEKHILSPKRKNGGMSGEAAKGHASNLSDEYAPQRHNTNTRRADVTSSDASSSGASSSEGYHVNIIEKPANASGRSQQNVPQYGWGASVKHSSVMARRLIDLSYGAVDGAVHDIKCALGSVEVILPDNVNIEMKLESFFGDMEAPGISKLVLGQQDMIYEAREGTPRMLLRVRCLAGNALIHY